MFVWARAHIVWAGVRTLHGPCVCSIGLARTGHPQTSSIPFAQAVPARVALSVIGLLTLTNVSNAISASLPRLSGKVWLLDMLTWSIAFIAYASFEFTIVNMLFRIEHRIDKVRVAALKRRADAKKMSMSMQSPPPSPPAFSETEQDGVTGVPEERGVDPSRRRHRKRSGGNSKGAGANGEPGEPNAPAEPDAAAQTDAYPKTPVPASGPVTLKGAGGLPVRGSSSNFLPKWNSKGYLFPQGGSSDSINCDGAPRSLRRDMMKLGVCRLDRFLLKRDGGMLFRDQHVDVFSRWAYPFAYCVMLIIIYNQVPQTSTGSLTDDHDASVPGYCSGRGPNMVLGIER